MTPKVPGVQNVKVFFRVVVKSDSDVDALVDALAAFRCTRSMTTRAPTREVQGVAEVASEAALEQALRARVPHMLSLVTKPAQPSPVVAEVERVLAAYVAEHGGSLSRTDVDSGLRQEVGAHAALIEAVFQARVPGGILVVTAGLSADPTRAELSILVADSARSRKEAEVFLRNVQQHLEDEDDVAIGHHINSDRSYLILEDPVLRAGGLSAWRFVGLTDDEVAFVRAWDGIQFGVELARIVPSLSSAPRRSILTEDPALAARLRAKAKAEGSSIGRLTLRQLLVLDVAGGIEVRLSRADVMELAAALRTTRAQSAPFVVEGPNAAIAFRARSPAGCHRADESRLLLVDVPPSQLGSLADWLVEPVGLGPVPGLSIYAR